MRIDNELRSVPVQRRAAFSLAELVVSVGVLVLMLAIAGEVMRLTMAATGQARGLTELHQQLRVIERIIRDDLRCFDPHQSVLFIQGNPINAYWTEAARDADDNAEPADGYPHGVDPERADRFEPDKLAPPRADILMFFTARTAASTVHPDTSATLQQVVYGHADLGQYTYLADGTTAFTPDAELLKFPTDADTYYPVPAERWHLARRAVLLSPSAPAAYLVTPPPTVLDDAPGYRLLRGETDVIENFLYDDRVLTPGGVFDSHYEQGNLPLCLPLIFKNSTPYARSRLDPEPPPTVASGVNQQLLANCASFQVEWALDPHSSFVGGRLDGESQVYWFDPGVRTAPNEARPEPLRTLREAADQATGDHQEELEDLRTVPLVGDGNHVYSLENRFNGPTGDDEWRAGFPENAHVFTGARLRDTGGADPGPEDVIPEDLFPGALRITIDVYDRERRLERPMRHVIIVKVGA